jgi:hypothetical protein
MFRIKTVAEHPDTPIDIKNGRDRHSRREFDLLSGHGSAEDLKLMKRVEGRWLRKKAGSRVNRGGMFFTQKLATVASERQVAK